MVAVSILAALAAAFFNGLAAVLQQGAAKRLEGRRSVPPSQVLPLVRQRRWIVGQVSDIVALLFQAIALAFGALIFVQPLLVMALPFAMVVRALAVRRWPHRRGLTGAAVCVVGLSLFLLIAQPRGEDPSLTLGELFPMAVGVAVALAVLLPLARFAPGPNWRAVCFALAAGVLFGITAGLTDVVTSQLQQGIFVPLRHWTLYAAIVAGVSGVWMTQNALKPGALAAPVAVLTMGDPLTSIAIGLLWLNESVNTAPWAIAAEVVTLGAMGLGVVILAGQSPAVAAPAGHDSGSAVKHRT